MEQDICIVLCNVPDIDTADQIGRRLVEERVAACVNLLFPCRSYYRWDEEIERAEEIPLLIKTTRAAYPALQALITELHPYDVPEIVAISAVDGLPAYGQWVAQNVQSS